jgi:hypothetical protein
MPDPTHETLSDVVLNAIWGRLEKATEVATSAGAVSRLAEVARHCDETAILARGGRLLLDDDP